MKQGKDLSIMAPVSPRERVGGFALLPRTIDKCRALLWGKLGDYHYDCPFDNVLFAWKGIKGDDLKAFVAEGHSDEEIAEWVKVHGAPKTDAEIMAWSDALLTYRLQGGGTAWLEGENTRLGIPTESSLMDMLDADDKAVFAK